ncbi:MAG: MBL fold metallo-hydrolase [Clostridia bacterium]|nr:MBL fold metallo-hydrolase [Clostridia bacterium]
MKDRKATVTYYHHSGFTVEIGETLMVFDYWRGENGELDEDTQLSEQDFEGYKRILVFVSHDHEDHLDNVIYSWDNRRFPITYIIAWDSAEDKRGRRVQPGDRLEIGDVEVRVFSSTDKGVSYYVTAGELNVFHAGDLNLWHWREESSLREIAQAERDFNEAMQPIEQLPIDIAMFPVDPRMGGLYDAGANYFVMAAKPRLFIPMHWQGRTEVAANFARKGKTRYTEVLALTKPRERAELEFIDNELRIHVFTAPQSVRKRGTDETVFDASDPFADTDLPVKLD